MTVNISTEQLFSTDIRLYNLLKDKQSENPLLNKLIISGPDEDKLKNEDYALFIGETVTNHDKDTNKSSHFNVQLLLTISTKDDDYIIAKTQMDIATKQVIKLIKKDDDLGRVFNKSGTSQVVTSKEYGCRYRKTILHFNESYDWEYEDDIDYTVLFGGVEVNGEEE